MVDVNKDKLPQHVAIIMDGNRRWAKERHLPVVAGHKFVADKVVEELIEVAGELGIPYITFWAWSSENWKRAEGEVSGIMQLFRWTLEHKAKQFIKKGAHLNIIGNWRALSPDIVAGIEKMMEASKHNSKITVTFAINYGGRDEIVRAINKAVSGKKQVVSKEITISEFSEYLDTAGVPDPDLIIRPGGEQRLSGFLLWQSEYSELYFPNVLMPDFRKEEFLKAIEEYQTRERRFGGK